jgi:glyoxylase-like metal-dependent hydrolase (beta-lactamase superfamily II)
MEHIGLKLGVTNCFLVRARSAYILIDTGYAYEWDLFCKRLRQAGVSLSEVSHVILTHHHDDHCGLLNAIVRENNDIHVVMSHLTGDILLSGKHYHTSGSGYVNKRISFLLSLKSVFDKRWTHTFPPYRVRENDVLVRRETRLNEIGIELEGKILETPGHSVDSISILLDDGDCFVGDSAANSLQWAGTKYCVISIDDLDDYYASWRKMVAGNARRIYPAHGNPFPGAELEKNLGKNKRENMVEFKRLA